MKAKFNRKENAIEGNPFNIIDVVELSEQDYAHFSQNLLDDYEFLKRYAMESRVDENGVAQCILVLGTGQDDGVLVNTEGYSCARYTSFLPCARQIALMQKHPSLNSFVKDSGELAEYYAKLAVDAQRNGHAYLNYYNIKATYGDELFSEKLFIDTMEERPEIASVDFAVDGYEIEIAKDYVTPGTELNELDEQDIKVMCAKHVLYQNDAGEEKADFSNCLLNGIDLANIELDGANFDNAVLVNVDMKNCSLCGANFNGAKLYNCNMVNIVAEESEFKNAKIVYSDMSKSLFTHSNFTGAQLIGCDVMGVDMSQSCIENTRFDDTDRTDMTLKNVVDNEKIWGTITIVGQVTDIK